MMTELLRQATRRVAAGTALVLVGALGLAILPGGSTAARADAPNGEALNVTTVAIPATGAPVASVSNFRCHVMPPEGATGTAAPPCDIPRAHATGGVSPSGFSVTNHGGPVITSSQHRFIFLNCPSVCGTDWGAPGNFLTDLFASSFIHIIDQYVGQTASGRYQTSSSGAQVVTSLPATINDTEVHTLIMMAINGTFNPNSSGGGGYNQMYSFFLPPGQNLCFDTINPQTNKFDCYCPNNTCAVNQKFSFCAYHGSFDATDKFGMSIHVIYQAMPYDNVAGCQTINGPNGTLIDSTNSVLSHEIKETISDPDLNAWFDPNTGNEISDNCFQTRQNPITLNTRQYDIQKEWSNNFPDQTTNNGVNGFGSACVGYTPLVSTHDFNYNQASDIAWRSNTGDVALWLMKGAVVSTSAGLGNVATNWSIVGQRDFDGDGKYDILWRDTTGGNVAVWLMNGTTVTSPLSLGIVPPNWIIVATGDFDGDGHGDILWRDNNTATYAMWLMKGGTVVSSKSLGVVPINWVVAGTGDFNQDGKADILWRDTTGGDVAVWIMNGTTLVSNNNLGNVTTNWSVVATGDFNGDQRTDILWRDTSGNVAVWIMNGVSVSSSAGLGLVPPAWIVADTGDYNFDFKSDILWRNTSTGDIAVWFMNGPSVTSSAGVATIGTVWTIQGTNVD